MITHAPLFVSEILENIENSENQKELIKAYMTMGPLWPFLDWYYSTDLRKIQDRISYRQAQFSETSIGSSLKVLKSLHKFSEEAQISILDRLMETLPPTEVMLMEHVFTKTLEEYYDGIDWELFDVYIKRYSL